MMRQQSEAMLKVKDLKKYFKTPRGPLHAVDGVSFDLHKEKTLGVVGESGCGKSTLGRTIIGLLDATGGEIIFDGEHIENAGKKRRYTLRRQMQIIFQDPFSSLNPRMCVSETIEEPLIICRTYKDKAERARRVRELMDTVGLAQRLNHSFPHELDGGRRQRIGIARALAMEPGFIVCDEPVSALDVSIQAQILNLMQDLQQEKKLTYLFITHDLSVVRHISDDILVMYLGHAVEKAPAKELFIRHYHPYTQALLSAIPQVKDRKSGKKRIILKGEISSPINPEPGCRFAPRCAHAIELCMQRTPEFVEITPNHYVACHRAHELELNA